jgi:hypothetical protein
MTKSTALVEIGIPNALAEGSPPALFLKEARAAERFFDFFTANIRNKHTRRAYYSASCRFSEFCAERAVRDLAQVKPIHVLDTSLASVAPAIPSRTALGVWLRKR